MDLTKKKHPKMLLWYWNQQILENKKYLTDLDRIAQESRFNTVCATARSNQQWDPSYREECESINFWDPSYKDIWQETVSHAHELGLKLLLQVWPKGFGYQSDVGVEEAVAIVTEHKAIVRDGKALIRSQARRNRWPQYAPMLHSEVLFSCSFEACGEGTYVPNSLQPVKGNILFQVPGSVSVEFSLPEQEGKTVYVLVAHYFRTPDSFSDAACRDYSALMDAYADIPFDGVVFDEYKSILLSNSDITSFRERIYGQAFARYFREQTGDSLTETMFRMRWCPKGQEQQRMAAINQYFDILRHGARRVERFVADYARKIYGKDSFLGLHGTFHNNLCSDDLWLNGANWWEVPRQYAQTDEDIAYPVRMGIACQCPENLTYDMYYGWEPEKFYEKAVRDARFGSRIHYHAFNDRKYGIDPMDSRYLPQINAIEEKISLLDRFDPAMPKMELLVVFGFPALCNWYPDENARNKWDLNKNANIQPQVKDLWNTGYLNALAPSDALCDGRITYADGKFDYCGHTFKKLLFAYPEYSKQPVLDFLCKAQQEQWPVSVIGTVCRDFCGQPVDAGLESITLPENAHIPTELGLTAATIENGCLLEDGSVVLTDLASIKEADYCQRSFTLQGHNCLARFRGVFALKLNEDGSICKLASGNLQLLQIDGCTVVSNNGEQDCLMGV